MNNINILIVEDEIIIYMHLIKTIKSFGFTNIHTARNYEDALSIANDVKIDILFSDIKIEGDLDGIDTAYTLQKLYGMPVIFITAYKDKEIIKRVSKVDTIGYLLKPYRVDELEVLIELAISKYNLGSRNIVINIDNKHSYDKKEKKLYCEDEEIFLTKKESVFLSILIENINTFVSYELLESLIWYDEVVAYSSRRTFYSRTRQKISSLTFQTQRSSGIGIFTNKSM